MRIGKDGAYKLISFIKEETSDVAINKLRF